VDIGKIFGWLIVIDKSPGLGSTRKDLVALMLFSDGSDFGSTTVQDVDNMEPQVFLDWMKNVLLPSYGVTYTQYLTHPDADKLEVW